jgi:hypothetical protein
MAVLRLVALKKTFNAPADYELASPKMLIRAALTTPQHHSTTPPQYQQHNTTAPTKPTAPTALSPTSTSPITTDAFRLIVYAHEVMQTDTLTPHDTNVTFDAGKVVLWQVHVGLVCAKGHR